MNARQRILAAYGNACAWCQSTAGPCAIAHVHGPNGATVRQTWSGSTTETNAALCARWTGGQARSEARMRSLLLLVLGLGCVGCPAAPPRPDHSVIEYEHGARSRLPDLLRCATHRSTVPTPPPLPPFAPWPSDAHLAWKPLLVLVLLLGLCSGGRAPDPGQCWCRPDDFHHSGTTAVCLVSL